MNTEAAKRFVLEHARPVDLAVYKYFFEDGPNTAVIRELKRYQNQDGGFGHGLELDCWNPNSSPITTNDAVITLFRVDALKGDSEMTKGIVRYLESGDAFDREKKRWLFAIDSNREYPHGIWWEKEGDGIHGFNPTMSLAAVEVCFGNGGVLYEEILREGMEYLRDNEDVSGEALKCFMLAYELLLENHITQVIDLSELKMLISRRLSDAICKDIKKYGVEYVPVPSDFFAGSFSAFITPSMKPLIAAEQAVLERLQMEDGGFDITWEWGTDDSEFHQARSWWRPRLTIDKLLFDGMDK